MDLAAAAGHRFGSGLGAVNAYPDLMGLWFVVTDLTAGFIGGSSRKKVVWGD